MTPEMDAERWTRIRTMFDELVDLDTTSRSERLAIIDATDPDLGCKVAELLAADAEADTFLAHIGAAIARAAPVYDRAEHHAEPDRLKLVGRTVSHFRIIELIAAGGMGVVYRAEDTKLQRTIALKFPLPTGHFGPDSKERFLREARSAGALDHTNVCSIYAIGETDDGHLFLAMPLYDGETLKARLAREGPLVVTDAIAIAKQIALGLAAAHKGGIVHRDVKPANVMLLPDGTVKVLDFGLAKVRDLTVTAPRARVGTVSYMSPEQIEGGAVDGRTDLWSLGVMLYEMLAGHRPFEGDYDVSVAHAIVHAEPIPLSTSRSDVAPEFDDVISKLLSKDPDARYGSANEVASLLAAAHAGHALEPHQSPRIRARRDRRAPVTYRRAAVGVATLGVIATGAWWLAHKGTDASTVAPRTLIVLPFSNPSDNPDYRYLAVGLSDGIGTELSRLRSVVAPSTNSMFAYRGSTKPVSQIARERSSGAVVTGSVQRAGDRLRVAVRLVDTTSDRALWERIYDRPLTDILAIQREATEAIIAALHINVTKAERARLTRLPTTSSEAYDLFLRGREVEIRGMQPAFGYIPAEYIRDAQSFYSRARELDPTFVMARARLAMMHVYSARRYDTTTTRSEQARLEAEAAVRIQPGLGEAHEVLALYWDRRLDRARAMAEEKLALDGFPNGAEYHQRLGAYYRDQGLWEEAIAELDRAMQLAPHSSGPAFEAGMTYGRLRRWPQAIAVWDRLIALEPGVPLWRMIRGYQFIRWQGTADTLAAVMRQLPATWDDNGMGTWARFLVARIQHRNIDALSVLKSSTHEISFDGLMYRPRVLLFAQTYDALGEHSRARSNYEASRSLLVDSIAARPRDPRIRIALGLSYAGLNRRQDAVREARRAMETVPLTQNNTAATAYMGGAAEVLAQAGETKAALELLEQLLAMPAGREVSVPLLRVDPAYDRIRNDPGFEQLLKRFSTK